MPILEYVFVIISIALACAIIYQQRVLILQTRENKAAVLKAQIDTRKEVIQDFQLALKSAQVVVTENLELRGKNWAGDLTIIGEGLIVKNNQFKGFPTEAGIPESVN